MLAWVFVPPDVPGGFETPLVFVDGCTTYLTRNRGARFITARIERQVRNSTGICQPGRPCLSGHCYNPILQALSILFGALFTVAVATALGAVSAAAASVKPRVGDSSPRRRTQP